MNCRGDLRNADRLIISLESSHRICNQDDFDEYDLVILDEVETLLSILFSDTVKNGRVVFDNFLEILKGSKKVIALVLIQKVCY